VSLVCCGEAGVDVLLVSMNELFLTKYRITDRLPQQATSFAGHKAAAKRVTGRYHDV
jgi:hypothetical protein